MESGGIRNLSRTPNEALTKLGLKQNLPPKRFDGMIGIGSDAAEVRVGKDSGLPASRTLIVFHELVENFLKTERGQQYLSAHSGAIAAEKDLRLQRPEFNNFAFGAGIYKRKLK